MDYSNKVNKYYMKNLLFGGVDTDYKTLYENTNKQLTQLILDNKKCNTLMEKYLWKGVETDLELYIPEKQYAGESENIWPLITKNYNKKDVLGVKSITDPSINFIIEPNHIDKNDEPILGRGTFTAVYELENLNKTDFITYILRLYERDTQISKNHMVYNSKIEYEYTNYGKYLIKIFYYGVLKITDNEFKYISNPKNSALDTFQILPSIKNYNFDYIITKSYNTPIFDASYNITNLKNVQKYIFLYNNVIMLNTLSKNNSFHADYKIGNVGWEDPLKMNVILIDYDIDTIQQLNNTNSKIGIKNGLVTSIYFPSTFIPGYIKNGNRINAVPVEQYIKYSIGGLNQIIQSLNISFTQKTIKISENLAPNRKITTLNLNDLGTSLHLTNPNYDLIPTYDEILNILMFIKSYIINDVKI